MKSGSFLKSMIIENGIAISVATKILKKSQEEMEIIFLQEDLPDEIYQQIWDALELNIIVSAGLSKIYLDLIKLLKKDRATSLQIQSLMKEIIDRNKNEILNQNAKILFQSEQLFKYEKSFKQLIADNVELERENIQLKKQLDKKR